MQGVVGEMATIPVWGRLDALGSRGMNLCMGVYYLLLWTPLLTIAIVYREGSPWSYVEAAASSTNSTSNQTGTSSPPQTIQIKVKAC